MPSESDTPVEGTNIVDDTLARLGPALDEFRSAVATADEEVRSYRTRHQEATSDPVGLLERELGNFARGLVDPARLAGLLSVDDATDPMTDQLMAQAHDLFAGIMAGGRGAFHFAAAPGKDLRDTVRDALAELGRAFGMAHAVEKARENRYDPDQDYTLLHEYPFHLWSPLEKELAPPLVVEVDGKNLRAAGLVDFLDGWQKIVLVVKGKAPPAPLARLVSPGVFVAQCEGDQGGALVEAMAPHHGPGVVAIFQEGSGALSFTHRPGQPLEVDGKALEGAMEEVSRMKGQPGILDLKHLESLRGLPGSGAAAGNGAGGAKTADQLAAWLLSRTDLTEE